MRNPTLVRLSGQSSGGSSVVGGRPFHVAATAGSPSAPFAIGSTAGVRISFDRRLLEPLEARIRALEDQLASLRSATTRQVSIATLDDARYRLRHPLPVELSVDDGGIVAVSHDFELYAWGEDDWAALSHLRQIILEEFEFLRSHSDELGPGPSAQLQRFDQLIQV